MIQSIICYFTAIQLIHRDLHSLTQEMSEKDVLGTESLKDLQPNSGSHHLLF